MKNIRGTSPLLNDTQHELIGRVLSLKSAVLACAVVKLYEAVAEHWRFNALGAICFVKDNVKRSYFLKLYDFENGKLLFNQELFTAFTYEKSSQWFHQFPADSQVIGLNFASGEYADEFGEKIKNHLQRRRRSKRNSDTNRRSSNLKQQAPPLPTVVTNVSVPHVNTPPKSVVLSSGKGDSSLKKKGKYKARVISKSDISKPSDFRHVDHMGMGGMREAHFSDVKVQEKVLKLIKDAGLSFENVDNEFVTKFINDNVTLEQLAQDADEYSGLAEVHQQEVRPAKVVPQKPISFSTKVNKPSGPPPPPAREMRPPPPPPPPLTMNAARSGPPAPPSVAPPPPPPPPNTIPPPPPPSMVAPTPLSVSKLTKSQDKPLPSSNVSAPSFLDDIKNFKAQGGNLKKMEDRKVSQAGLDEAGDDVNATSNILVKLAAELDKRRLKIHRDSDDSQSVSEWSDESDD